MHSNRVMVLSSLGVFFFFGGKSFWLGAAIYCLPSLTEMLVYGIPGRIFCSMWCIF